MGDALDPAMDAWWSPSEPPRSPRAATRIHRVLAAIDLGAPPHRLAAALIETAWARAEEVGGRLAICHVVAEDPDDRAAGAQRVAVAHRRLSRLLDAQIGPPAATVDVFIPTGEPVRMIHECADAWRADLVVIGPPEGAGGTLARLFRRGLVDHLVRWSPCAVLVHRAAQGSRRLVVGADFADPDRAVLRVAAAEQARRGAAAFVVHCVAPSATLPTGDPTAGVMPAATWADLDAAMLSRLAEAARDAGLAATAQVIHDSAGVGLVQAAEDLEADLVIVGTHTRGALARLALGSVAQHVVDDAPCAVLVVRLDNGTA
jgi:nucleotide-binding universal stress UspA family protein